MNAGTPEPATLKLRRQASVWRDLAAEPVFGISVGHTFHALQSALSLLTDATHDIAALHAEVERLRDDARHVDGMAERGA